MPENDGDWALYAWDSRRNAWALQHTGVTLEFALTQTLKWKSEGQTVRLENTAHLTLLEKLNNE